ncbi:hypothetical protein LTR56_005921 [Elasticomyces elasticus]|nr:hypothetical protein LTR56_005921 [Elasticomyces elasticus]KAK3664854.1 hypothetical protein LTR22_004160 [Elasticomyces elasticus]KAK4912740.1 hypothetical protein LTR49_018809 [Elasticomyces elasticus]KAK5752186.1 hypothetical protein LTS12_017781 [Elasticomyces elasticus]
MPPKTRTKANAKAALAKNVPSSSSALSFELWKTDTRLASGGDLKQISQWRVDTTSYSQTVEVHHNEQFTLKPLTITDGEYKGRQVLMLMPVKITEYFPFMELPPELRQMVYEIVLLEEKSKEITIDSYKPKGLPRRPVQSGFRSTSRSSPHHGLTWDKSRGKWIGQQPSNMGLLRVSHQLRRETAPVVYGLQTFHCLGMSPMEVFLDTIGDMRKYLKHLPIQEYAYKPGKERLIFSLLRDAKSLRSIAYPHGLLCGDKRAYQYGNRSSVEGLMREAAPMLKALHESREHDVTAVSVLDIIKLGRPRLCYQCERNMDKPNYKCANMSCGYPCSEIEKHHTDFETRLRAGIATEVGITMVVDGEME